MSIVSIITPRDMSKQSQSITFSFIFKLHILFFSLFLTLSMTLTLDDHLSIFISSTFDSACNHNLPFTLTKIFFLNRLETCLHLPQPATILFTVHYFSALDGCNSVLELPDLHTLNYASSNSHLLSWYRHIYDPSSLYWPSLLFFPMQIYTSPGYFHQLSSLTKDDNIICKHHCSQSSAVRSSSVMKTCFIQIRERSDKLFS